MSDSLTLRPLDAEPLYRLRDLLSLLAAIRQLREPLTTEPGLRAALDLLASLAELVGIEPTWIERVDLVLANPHVFEIVLAIVRYVSSLIDDDGDVELAAESYQFDCPKLRAMAPLGVGTVDPLAKTARCLMCRLPPIYRLPPLTVEATCVALAESIDWGLAAYNIPAAWKQSRGEGVTVAVLDTGIDPKHPDLAEAITDLRDFTASRGGPIDIHGHGTHVAGIIAARQNDVGLIGLAPACRLLVGKVLRDDGSGDERAIAAGIEWAVERGADILSLSFGSPRAGIRMESALRAAAESGKFILCAAGNDGRANSVNYPARWPFTIAVGAVDRQGRLARFSSQGDELDICAPGEDVLSAAPGGGYAKLSGTSMATPFVSGVVALMLAKHRRDSGSTPLGTIEQLREHLARTATDAGPTGHDPHYGFGLINPAGLLGESASERLPVVRIGPLLVNGVERMLVFTPK